MNKKNKKDCCANCGANVGEDRLGPWGLCGNCIHLDTSEPL